MEKNNNKEICKTCDGDGERTEYNTGKLVCDLCENPRPIQGFMLPVDDAGKIALTRQELFDIMLDMPEEEQGQWMKKFTDSPELLPNENR